jgi:hypothetical protein
MNNRVTCKKMKKQVGLGFTGMKSDLNGMTVFLAGRLEGETTVAVVPGFTVS